MPVNNKPKELGSLGLLCFKRIDFKTNLVDIVSNEIVIDGNSSEINIALLEDKKLVELSKEKSNVEFAVGNIFLAKVKKIMPGLNAAFIDVGYEKDAFLHYLDLGPQFNSLKKYVSQVLSKKTKSENPKITINFKDFKNTSSEIGFSKLNNDTIVLNGIKIFDYYRIENESASINEVKTIIWTDSKGLTAYQLKNRGWMTINYSKSIDKEALSV